MAGVTNIYLIKDLSRLSGHSIHTLKFYLKLSLIKETGRSPQTQFRYFDDSVLEQLSKIRAWRKEQKSLAEISRLLTDHQTPESSEFGIRPPRLSSARPGAYEGRTGEAGLGSSE